MSADQLMRTIDNLTLTPVNHIVQMRPQFHYIDAQADQEKSAQRSLRNETSSARQTEARAVQMTVKTTADGDEIDMSQMATTLRAVQEENWTRLAYVDEDVSFFFFFLKKKNSLLDHLPVYENQCGIS
jgi:DNA-directed RNA polymerase-3 subunit RPC5